MPSRRLAVFREPQFLTLRELLHSTDACFANLESGDHYALGDGFDICTKCDENDVRENSRQVSEARRQADWVIVSLHIQELVGRGWLTAKKRTELTAQPDFVHDFARRCIDAGADGFACHGPHILMGIEIYRGKPIFYSFGNLILQNDTLRHVPAYPYDRFGLDPRSTPSDFFDHRSVAETKGHPASAEFWQSVVAICRYKSHRLEEITLYPVEMGYGRPRAQHGRPVLAGVESGKTILDRVARLSEPYGTRLELRDSCAVIRCA
ncbi:MAG: CapA family protein [Chloroflexota bacterium]